jgi:threonine synthase
VLVATSGDTGGAVAAGFHGVDGIEVVILYPKGKVSRVQELQLTTLGDNVTAIEVDGVFDDCQTMAKAALADKEIQDKVFLTSANSINIARWLPQQFYYFFALKQWQAGPPVFCVPSGNFGNICSGLLAHVSGMPASGFIAACNANAVVPEFLKTGAYVPQPSIATISNAMDVGNPSNFVRVLELFGREFDQVKENVAAVSITDEQTAATMRDVYDRFGYVLDPHGAVAFRALEDSGKRGIILETAHPVKFDSVAEILGVEPEVPDSVAHLYNRTSEKIEMAIDQRKLKEIILSKI